MRQLPAEGPVLVFGPASLGYDFGPGHPLTPLRFGPGIDLLRHVGAEAGLAPQPATDDELLTVHLPEYVATVGRFSANPDLPGAMGIGLSDNPAFPGMHGASATVAAGSIRGVEALIDGRVEHAYQPGGGLHHAMPARAAGFCIYNDPALAVVRARAAGLRVLYVDLDVHHGDGVQVVTYADPGVVTVSFHESGRYLFPGTGFPEESGEGASAGTSVNMPFEPYAGERSWLAAVRALLPAIAAVFGPDLVVSQHGADSHAWDPLAHLRVTTTAHAEAARIVDAIAHRWASGRWLATGGGGYDAYRVVPRTWALTWLAGAHREPDHATPFAWRERWATEAAAFGTPGMPSTFLDAPNAGQPVGREQVAADETSLATLERVRRIAVPRLVREAEDRGWWRPALLWAGRALEDGRAGGGDPARPGAADAAGDGSRAQTDPGAGGGNPAVRMLDGAALAGLSVAPRTISPVDPADARSLLLAAAAAGARIAGAVDGGALVGVAIAAQTAARDAEESLLALGVAPAYRRRGVATALLRRLVEGAAPRTTIQAAVGVAERDVVEPLDVELRIEIARRLLGGTGFDLAPAPPADRRDDRFAIAARRVPG